MHQSKDPRASVRQPTPYAELNAVPPQSGGSVAVADVHVRG